jgi:hypothetical protein
MGSSVLAMSPFSSPCVLLRFKEGTVEAAASNPLKHSRRVFFPVSQIRQVFVQQAKA